LYDLLLIDVKMPKMNGFELYTTKCAPMTITAAFLIYGLVFPVDFVFAEKPDSVMSFCIFHKPENTKLSFQQALFNINDI
jgi:hypothetical protein